MKSLLDKAFHKPIALLIAVNLLIGVFIFRHYGLSWDEPFFYQYADALGYAYSPHEWLSGEFDLENSYGPSAEDHKTRGPAYLFLARNVVYGLQALGSDSASAWHLVNFLFFQLGVYLFYRFATRWITTSAAFITAAFFAYQPLLWGHAFINPKDSPFLVFFLAAVTFGFEMVDEVFSNHATRKRKIVLAALCLGIATSIRVLGPLAGVIVLAYAIVTIYSIHFTKPAGTTSPPLKIYFRSFATYGVISIAAMLLTWPYLWENPIARLLGTLHFMSDNPTQLAVLFNGEIFRADNMPRRYIPFMLGSTLTEPTWILFAIGLIASIWSFAKKKMDVLQSASLALTFIWFALLVVYAVIRQPAMYDGVRHFLFILPPVFVLCGFTIEWILDKASIWLRAGMVLLVLLPGMVGIVQLHPYEYAYYNSFVGGTSGVFRQYETEYWLTCYKEVVEQLDKGFAKPFNLFVHREAYIAQYYASSEVHVIDLRDAMDEIQSGDYVLVNSRTNDDRSVFRDAPPVVQIRRGDAIFCEVKQIP